MASVRPANEFLRRSRKATPVVLGVSLLLIGVALFLAALQWEQTKDEAFAAIISLQFTLVIASIIVWLALAYLSYIAIWRGDPLFEILCKAIALPGVVLAFLSVIVGALLAHQKHGIWWNWDDVTTSMLALAIILFGQVALDAAQRKSSTGGAKSPLLFILFATSVMPFILGAIFWWKSVTGQLPDAIMYQFVVVNVAIYPAITGLVLLITAITLMRARTIFADTVIEAQMQEMHRKAGA